MDTDGTQISRKQLYEEVWSRPVTKLAKRYGLSDVGFAKICRKHNIPRPPRGYWARKRAGEKLKRKPLPYGKDELITINPNPFNTRNNGNVTMSEISSERDKDNRIIVLETLKRPHPLVKQAIEVLKSCEPNAMGILELPKDDCLDIQVSKKTRSRALRIMDALIKALENRGYDVHLSRNGTETKILDVTLNFGISEELQTKRTQPKDHDLNGYYRFGHSRFDTTRVPSGRLCLTIDNFGHSYRGRRNWRDSKTKQLEDWLNAFIAGLLKMATWEKKHIEEVREKERQQREWLQKREEQTRLRAEKRRRIEEEQAKVLSLISDAENWRKSQLLREYIVEIERLIQAGTCPFQPEGDSEDWLKWAKQQADRLDPLTPSPESILDEHVDDDEKDEDHWNGFPSFYNQ